MYNVIGMPKAKDHMPMDSLDIIIDALITNLPPLRVFNCQMEKGRITVGILATCRIKEIILMAELRSDLET